MVRQIEVYEWMRGDSDDCSHVVTIEVMCGGLSSLLHMSVPEAMELLSKLAEAIVDAER